MQRICHAVTTKFPELKFIGLCHEIASMERQLPDLMKTDFSNINFRAGGLNHFSVLLNVNYKDTGEDGYPIIRKNFDDYYSGLVNQHEGFKSKPGAERGVFKKLFQEYKYLPITTDSHLGEYLQWAYSVADHDAILDFYDNYKVKCLNFYNDAEHYNHFFDLNNSETHERVIPIIEAIIGDTGLEESAVNIPNNEYIDCLPDRIVVEVPAKINNQGIHGITLENYPKGFGNLLNSQVGVIQLTTEAILSKSKHFAYLALLADPVVDNAIAAEKLLDNIIEKQSEFLGYLN
jgi:alpha-galactosidase